MHAPAMSGVLNYRLLFNVSFQVCVQSSTFSFFKEKTDILPLNITKILKTAFTVTQNI
jgi:hypothetical protein